MSGVPRSAVTKLVLILSLAPASGCIPLPGAGGIFPPAPAGGLIDPLVRGGGARDPGSTSGAGGAVRRTPGPGRSVAAPAGPGEERASAPAAGWTPTRNPTRIDVVEKVPAGDRSSAQVEQTVYTGPDLDAPPESIDL